VKFTLLRQYIKRNPFMAIFGIIVILFLSRTSLWQASPKSITHHLPCVVVNDMTANSVVTNLQLNGHSSEARRVILKAKTGGRILSLVAAKGQQVEKGQDLILIDQEDRPARLLEAKARMNQRSLEFKADTKLEAKAIKSQNTLAASMADYESAKSALSAIEHEIADTHIKAPFKSILEDTAVETGDVVAPGDKVGAVIEIDPLKIICDVSEKDVARLKIGEEAHVVFSSLDDKIQTGHVTFIAKAAEPKTRTYRVEIQISNPNMEIPAGLTARISFPTHKTNGYLISPATISLRDDGTIGVKTVEDGKVVFHKVEIEETKPDGLLVTGLPDKIKLVTTGGDFVVEGQEVQTSQEPHKPLEKTT
jgi:multidrug efflux system membrane fusion protein